MLSNVSKKEEKIILFIRKEPLLPDFGIFKRLNAFYWNFIFNFCILKVINKYKNRNLLIVSDYPNQVELEKRGIKSKAFGDYARHYEQDKRYLECKELITKWSKFDNIKKILNYKGIDLWYALEEEFSFWLITVLYETIVLKRIVEIEKPGTILLNSRRSVTGRCCESIAKKRGIVINSYSNKFGDYAAEVIRNLIKGYSFAARFYKMPGMIRREFVKTGNLSKIKCKRNNILILGFDKLYYSRIENVVKELLKSRDNNVVMVTTKTNMQDELKNQGLNYVSFGDFLNQNMKKDINEKNREVVGLWKRLEKDKEFCKLLSYKGENLEEVIKKDLEFYFCIKFKWIMHYIETSKVLMDKLNINLVATICDFITPTRSAVMAAKSKSIPTLMVQQGLQVDDSGRFFIPLTCDKIALWGPADKEYMGRWGIADSRLIVTGSSLHDSISIKKISTKRKEELLEKLGLDGNKKTVLLVSQAFEGIWGENTRKRLIELVVNTIKNRKDMQLIIKLHPREEEEMPKKIVEKYNPKNVVITKKEFDIDELIDLSDVMVTLESTCIYDAILLRKPVISVNLIKFPEQVAYVKSGACMGVYQDKDFKNALKTLFRGKMNKKFEEGRKRFIEDYFYKTDGKASARVAELIYKMIKEQR
ncbi:MAG: UDP-N-acetylglucosamine 2-epimerase [archaeon]